MKWTDGSTYMGTWEQGIQHGIGVMIFPDGTQRAGLFVENVFKQSLKRQDQLDPYKEVLKEDCFNLLQDILDDRLQSKANLMNPVKAELRGLDDQGIPRLDADKSQEI